MDFAIVFLFLSMAVGSVVGQLRCYTCSFSAADTDQSCLTISNDTASVDCSMQYCTIMRQEFVDPVGTVASFLRGCEDFPDYLNHDVTDDTFRTFFRACTNDLCNTGNGIESVVGGNLDPNPQQQGPNLLVPGTGGANRFHVDMLLISSALLYLMH